MRNVITRRWLLVLVLTGEGQVFGQDGSHYGKSFWLVVPLSIQDLSPVVYISAGHRSATVQFTGSTAAGAWEKSYVVPTNTTIASDVLPTGMELSDLRSMERTYDRYVHIESDTPIEVYAHFYKNVYSSAAMLVPEELWGSHYISVNSPGDHSPYLCVLAAHDQTLVEITPSVLTSLGAPAGRPFTVMLNKGQTYQLLAAMNAGELTGTNIRSLPGSDGSCYPVAVFSGSSGTPICGSSSDFIIQQLFPAVTWGKRYATAPFANSVSNSSVNTSIYRVIVNDPATVVKWNGAPLSGLVGNLYYEFYSDLAAYIEADQPVMVAQFMTSQVVQSGPGCTFTGAGLGDPEMMILSPLEQASGRSDFYLSYQSDILYNYVSVIIPTSGIPSLTIDGGKAFTYSYPHPNLDGYSVVLQRWIAAGKPCRVQSDSAFTGATYGISSYESYAYNITPLKNLAVSAELSSCTNIPFKWTLQTRYTPSRLEWDISVVDNPTPDSTIQNQGTVYSVYSSPQSYTFTTSGTYHIPVTITAPEIDNCTHTQTVMAEAIVNDCAPPPSIPRDSIAQSPPPPPPPVLPQLHVPNAFSPNGDGIHDTWEITGLGNGADIQVFNRWGQAVFASKGYSRPWDGRWKNSLLPAGVYYYIIEPGGRQTQLSGALNLLR